TSPAGSARPGNPSIDSPLRPVAARPSVLAPGPCRGCLGCGPSVKALGGAAPRTYIAGEPAEPCQGGPMTSSASAATPENAVQTQLPEWDLSDLYPGRDSPELKSDLSQAAADAKAFRARYEGKVAECDGPALGAAIAEFERQQEVLSRIMSYAQLVYAADMADQIGRASCRESP